MRRGENILCDYCGKFIRKDKKFADYANQKWKEGTLIESHELCNKCAKEEKNG